MCGAGGAGGASGPNIPLLPVSPGTGGPIGGPGALGAAQALSNVGTTTGVVDPDSFEGGENYMQGIANPPQPSGLPAQALSLGLGFVGGPEGAIAGKFFGDLAERLVIGYPFAEAIKMAALGTPSGIATTALGLTGLPGAAVGTGINMGIKELASRPGQGELGFGPEMGEGFADPSVSPAIPPVPMPTSPIPEQAALAQPVPIAKNLQSVQPVQPKTAAVPQRNLLAWRGIRGKGTRAPRPEWFQKGY